MPYKPASGYGISTMVWPYKVWTFQNLANVAKNDNCIGLSIVIRKKNVAKRMKKCHLVRSIKIYTLIYIHK